MIYPDPYFTNIPHIGNLYLIHVILDFDWPVLFLCRSDDGKLYICDCCDSYRELCWLIAPINMERLEKLFANQITMREAFTLAEGYCCVATWKKKMPHINFAIISSKDFAAEDLPRQGAFLEADEDEWEDCKEAIKRFLMQ